MSYQSLSQSLSQFSMICFCLIGMSSCAEPNQPTASFTPSSSTEVTDAAKDNVTIQYQKGIQQAIANVEPTSLDSRVRGRVNFTKVSDGVRIIAHFEGLTPGEHGFHIHEFADCGQEGEAAGGHFNPTHQPHGGADDERRHVGDLGNIKADADGKAQYDRLDKVIALSGEHSIIGHSIVVHAKPDDLKTQPSGNSGKRLGCGVIEAISVQ